jgi:hypothetical protein
MRSRSGLAWRTEAAIEKNLKDSQRIVQAINSELSCLSQFINILFCFVLLSREISHEVASHKDISCELGSQVKHGTAFMMEKRTRNSSARIKSGFCSSFTALST